MKQIYDPYLGRVRLQDEPIQEVVSRGGGTVINNSALYAEVGLTLPDSGYDGQIFYDTDDAILYVWANNTWNAISGGSPPATDHILLESGDFILLETGDKILTG